MKNVNSLPWVFLAIAGGYLFMKLKKRRCTSEKTPDSTDASNPSSSSSDDFVAGSDYEVFLSFRGSDTRTGFTDHLYHRLKDAGIRVFRDDEELRVGEEIGDNLLEAITQSKICIPIFSKDYASSKWCLKEVAHMVKCKNQLILPIFYDVTPNQVRHQSGTFKKAFRVHSKKYDKKTVQDWRNALAVIGDLKGWDLQNEENGHEGALVERVVSKVWIELNKAHLVVSDDYITGVEDRAEEVIRLLKVGGDDVRMVLLHGIGGSGKTTLAKIVYNQLSKDFDSCSFLKDIRETSSQPKGLEKLQAQLVTDILKPVNPENEFAGIDGGIQVLSKRLQGKKILILLDDVNERNQMEALAAKGSWFGRGSRIIITCRNTDGLDKSQLAGTYEVEGLPSDEALVLFCKHAFRRDSPVADYASLSREIVSMTGGLPLALEVIGSFLSGKSREIWVATFEKLQNQPDKKVENRLIISYEALEYEEKEMFLDIACFFIGADWKNASHMWKDRKFFPDIGIEVLLARSLIKLIDGNKIWMHDQLKDLGREIVRRENLEEPGERSRLWSSEEARNVLLSQKGTEKVAAMSLDYDFGVEGNCFESKCFINLSNLRYLRLSNADIMGDFGCRFSKLSWLYWDYCPIKLQASGLRLKNLLVLQLSESRITEGWDGWSTMQMAIKLKALILQSCWCLTKTPDLSGFPALETLNLDNCRELSYVDPSVAKLKKLIFISLKNCSRLMKLPQELSSLQALVELHLDGSGVQELPTLEGCRKLEFLSATKCKHLSHIPKSIGHLTSLLELLLDETGVSTLPDSIRDLLKLRRLSLRDCMSLEELPNSIGELASLQELCLSGSSLHTLPDSIRKLKNLQVLLVDRTRLINLPTTLEMLEKLEVLDASFCTSLSTIQTLCPLRTLKLNGTNITMLPMSISRLSCLETLELLHCDALQTLHDLPNSLESLSVTCIPIEAFPDLSNSMILMELRFISCWKLKEIPGLGSLKKLKTLMVSQCRELVMLDGLEELKDLRKLDIAHCRSLQSLPILSALKMLRHLSIVGCQKLRRVDGLGELESLEHLKIQNCQAIENLPDLSMLRKLKELILNVCENLRELQGLEELKSLKRVDIGHSPLLYRYIEKWPHVSWDDLPWAIGIESHMKDVMDLLEFDAGDVKIVGIYGMGGIGKTTLAKIIYSQLMEDFAYHSFISNIRETHLKKGIKELQRRLLSDILRPVYRQEFESVSVDEGFNQKLRDKKVLVILDDVDRRDQLHALVPQENLLAPGSRILLTTRNKDVLNANQIRRIYELQLSAVSDAYVLFCKHAFGSDTAPLDMSELARQITYCSGGYPLFLEVIGSFLYRKDRIVWLETLERLRRIPNQDIRWRLRISYEALCHEQKQIFLDIACFLSGTDMRIAVHMWEDCGFSPKGALTVLMSMSLIKIGNDNILLMHDLLRDLGRDIVREESPGNMGKRSRLWGTEEAREVIDDQEGMNKIEAFRLVGGSGLADCCFASEKFRLLSNHRYLELNEANITGDFDLLLPELRWLCWHRCPVELTVTNLCLKKLVILDLSESDITDDWNGWSFMQTSTNLKVLILKSCPELTKIPDLSSFLMLERLYLDGCTSLNHLGPSIGHLKKLVFLSVKGCYGLKDELPRVLSSLEASSKLCVDGP